MYGPYPFPSYTAVITEDELEIPLESQALSTFGRNHLAEDWEAERLTAHELSHQWFGNAVTLKRWQDIWSHEGFACYSEWLWAEETGRSTLEDEARRHHAALAESPEDLLVADPGPELMFDDRLYKRGALALHALRRRVGDETFFPLIRSWLAQNLGGSVTTEMFEEHAARESGEDLTDLFAAWLHDEEPRTCPISPPLDSPPIGGRGPCSRAADGPARSALRHQDHEPLGRLGLAQVMIREAHLGHRGARPGAEELEHRLLAGPEARPLLGAAVLTCFGRVRRRGRGPSRGRPPRSPRGPPRARRRGARR
ncbi:M1 family aminopeptidase [Brachybacterium sp. GPGPB12]|uniref:M1 family aminopeptidase n=1 Tax=Brachybacterium sp. GPGPB12 TaxID=3023517 RepID=UPI0031345E44